MLEFDTSSVLLLCLDCITEFNTKVGRLLCKELGGEFTRSRFGKD